MGIIVTNPLSQGGTTLPGGADRQVQFNDDGVFGGDDGFIYNKEYELLIARNISTPRLNLSSNNNPTPETGDFWRLGDNLYFRKASSTINITALAPAYGAATQIPFMNGTNDGFSYSSNLSFADNKLYFNGTSNLTVSNDDITFNVGNGAGGFTVKANMGNNQVVRFGITYNWIKYGLSLGAASGGSLSDNYVLKTLGKGSTSATTNVLLQNLSSTNLFQVLDSGNFSHTHTNGAIFSLSQPTASLQNRFWWSPNTTTTNGLILDLLTPTEPTFSASGSINFSRSTSLNNNSTTTSLGINLQYASIGFGKVASIATQFDFLSYRNNGSAEKLVNIANATYSNIFTILESGKVGIGVAAPLAGLDVINISAGTYVALLRQQAGTSAFTILESNGNVGLGNDSPTFKLDVNGNIRGSYINVGTSGVPSTLRKGDIYENGTHLYFYNGTTSIQLD